MLALPAPPTTSALVPFDGFYESLWSGLIDREEESLFEHIEEEPHRYDPRIVAATEIGKLGELLMDATDYRIGEFYIARDYIQQFFELVAGEVGLPSPTVRFEEIDRPRFYNFSTDRLFAEVPLYLLRAALWWAEDYFAEAVEAMFTSRSGFSSFYDNDAAALLAKPLEEWDHNEIGAILEGFARRYAAENSEPVRWEIYHDLSGEAHFYHDAALDWDKLTELAHDETYHLLTEAELERVERPRCRHTLELPL